MKCSKYNEVKFEDIKPYIKRENQIHRGDTENSARIGEIRLTDENLINIFACDEVSIYNVRFCLASAKDSYFDHEIQINIPDED